MKTRTGRLLVEGEFRAGVLTLVDGVIRSVELDAELGSDPELPYIAPGLVDLHIHGFGGCDPVDDLEGMTRALARAGTTAFQPTLFPRAPAPLAAEAQKVWDCAGRLASGSGARVLGLHLEGPFVNPEAAGALPPDHLGSPSPGDLATLLGPSTGDARGIRTMTLAPELPGAIDLIEELARSGVRTSLGHSLATTAEAKRAVKAGARGATHLFNAMRPWHHREGGLAGLALAEAALAPELIGDLVHVGPEAFELALDRRGPAGLCLISDALPGAGTGCDAFHWQGRDHRIEEGAAWFERTDAGGDEPALALAGSATGQLEAVRLLVRRGLVGLAEALELAGRAPARALGCEGELGVLAVGARADLITLAPGDLSLIEVLVGGVPLRASD